MNLKELIEQKKNLADLLAESYGEITPEMEQALMTIELNLPAKVDRYISLIEKLELDADYFKAKAKKFADTSKQICNLKDKLLNNVRENMLNNNLTELLGNDEKFKLAPNKGSIVIESEQDIPEMFYKTTIVKEIDKTLLKEAVLKGEMFAGVSIKPTLTRTVNKGIK